MIKITVDGELLYASDADSFETDILSPKLFLDVNGAGSFSFTLPPGNAMHDKIKKLKSIIVVEEDGNVLFRGRVMDDTRDIYNQKNVYCEGDRSFLLDSLKKPYTYKGNVKAFFRDLVSNHNNQVDEEKHFSVGEITAVSDDLKMEAEDDVYQSTSEVMESRLLGAYGGYLMTRTEGETTYLDWLKEPGSENGQTIEFSVNLLDLKDKLDASDVFTILIPLGASDVDDEGNEVPPVSIKSVNGGLEYIQDDEAVALYGKIWRTHTWAYEQSPSALLEKGREYMKTGALVRTLELTALDMHFAQGDAQPIRLGSKVHILSDPHEIDLTMACVKMEPDLLNPENTVYTFGEAPKTLTENFIQTQEDAESMTGRRGGGGGNKKLQAKLRWAIIEANEKTAQINLLTHDQNELSGRVSNAEIRLDGIDATIILKADRKLVDDLEERVTSAEIDIDGAKGEITTKVSKDGVISSINQSSESIVIKASRIDLSGYVTMDKFESTVGTSALLSVGQLTANTVSAKNSLYLGSKSLHTTQYDVVTSVSLSPSYTSVTNNEGNSKLVLVEGTSISRTKKTINVVTWE